MKQVAGCLHDFLMGHNIDPKKVKVVLSCDDVQTASLLEMAFTAFVSDLEPVLMFDSSEKSLSKTTGLTLKGITFVITDLD